MTLDAIVKGQKKEYSISVHTDDGGSAPLDLTGLRLVFTARKSPTAATYLVRKTSDPGDGISITDASGGVATLTIDAADTASAEAGRSYSWDLWLADTPAPLASGKWFIQPAITTDLS